MAVPDRIDRAEAYSDRPNDHRVEWWYFFGELRSTDPGRLGAWSFVTCLFRKRSALGGPSAWMAATQVIDLHRTRRLDMGAVAGVNAYDEADFRFWLGTLPGMPEWRLRRRPGVWDLHHHREVTLHLQLTDQSPPIPVGDGVMAYGGGLELGWYTLPFLDASGTITVGGDVVPVRGHAWMERQWGPAPVERFTWRYLTLRLDDERRLLAFHAVIDGHHTVRAYWFHPNGTSTPLVDVTLTPIPPASLGAAPVTRLRARGVDLLVAALHVDQLIRPGLPFAPEFYEGFSRVVGKVDGVDVVGVGMTELRAPSEEFLERPAV